MQGNDGAGILYERLSRAERDVRSILEGGKPVIDQRQSANGWIVDQLARLRAGFFVSEIPFAYTATARDTPEQARWKGDTRYHPLSYALVSEQKALEKYLAQDDIRNFKLLGVDYGFRDTRKSPAAQADHADNFILAPGDVYSLWQFIGLLKGKLAGDPALDGKNLILQNTDGFWNPFIGAMGLDNPALTQSGILHITDSYSRTRHIIGQIAPTMPARISDGLNIEPGSTILVATHQSNKVHEGRAIFETLGADVRVLPFNIVEKPEEARETSLTYAGNDMEKVHKTWDRLDEMGVETIAEILHERGIDPAKTWILWDDRGMELEEPLMQHPLFDECRSYLNPYKPGPGVELASVLKSMSREDLHARLHKAADDLAEARSLAGLPGTVDRTANELCTYMFSPIMPNAQGERPVYSFMAVQDNIVSFDPRPAADICKYPEHFIEPKSDPLHRTAAEIPDFIETQSCIALAARAAAYTLGLESHADQLSPRVQFNHAAGDRLWRVGTEHSLWGGAFAGESSPQAQGLFSFIPHGGGQFDPTASKALADGTGEHIREDAACLNNFYRFAREADAFLLTADEKKNDRNFARDMFTFFSAIVGKQIDDPVFAGKPLVVMDGANTAWETAMEVYYHLHRNGFAGDKPKHVFKRRDILEGGKDDSALGYIDDYMKHYIADYAGLRQFQEQGQKVPRDLFRVTIYCSATSTNENFRREAHDLAYELASEGFAIKNGGGTDGLMIETSNGVHDFRAWWDRNGTGPMPKNHISSVQCVDTYKSEGLCDFNDYVCVHKNIFQRMADLQDTDAEMVLWGGAGTVQELMGSILLRQAGIVPSVNRPLVIVNAEIGNGIHRTKVFDPLIKAMPAWYLEKLNVHVVDNIADGLGLIREARWVRGMAPAGTMPANHQLFRLRSDPPGPAPI